MKLKMRTLIGTSIYEFVKYALDECYLFLDRAAEAGANAFEIFLHWTWWAGYDGKLNKNLVNWQPFLLDDWKLEDGIYSPVFDLNKLNRPFWQKLTKILRRAKSNHMVPIARVHDFCSLKDRIFRRAYCYINNVQRERGTLSGGIWDEGVRPYYHRVNELYLEKLHAAEIKRHYMVPMNEADVIRNGWTQEQADARLIDFHKWYIKDLTGLGVKKSQLIMSVSRCYDEILALGCRMERHGINSDVALVPGINVGPGLFPNGDGYDPRAEGEKDSAGWRQPSVEQAEKMAPILKGTFGYCYIDRTYQKTANPKTGEGASPAKTTFDVISRLAKARE